MDAPPPLNFSLILILHVNLHAYPAIVYSTGKPAPKDDGDDTYHCDDGRYRYDFVHRIS